MRLIHLKYWLFLLITISSCSSPEQGEIVATRQLHFLLLPHELGDMGYGDAVLRGIQTIRRDAEDLDIRIYMPESIEEGENIFYNWATSDTGSQQSLFVITSDNYEEAVSQYFKDNDLAKGKDILLFESENNLELPVYSFMISTYGASYLAGLTAACVSPYQPLIVWGNFADISTFCAVNGFRDGYYSQSSSTFVATAVLANDWTGYAMANKTYSNMKEWTEQYGFIYPIAGGSNHGIYRYLREFPCDTYTAGFDIDCSHLSSNVVGSTIKYIDRLLISYVKQWLESGTMPEHQSYGLASEYVDWVLAPNYEAEYSDIIARERETAIRYEKDYETNF